MFWGHYTRTCIAVLCVWASLVSIALLADRSGRSRDLPCCLFKGRWLGEGPPSVELVLAHYNQNVTWLDPLMAKLGERAKLTVYSKGPAPPPGAQILPNVGREAHTYLHHLHNRYDSLADVTIFLMASAGKTQDKQKKLVEIQDNWQQALSNGFFCSGLDDNAPEEGYTQDSWKGSTDTGWIQLDPASPRPYGLWFAEYAGGKLPTAWCPTATMAVHRRRVRLRPRSFYGVLLEQLSVGRDLEAAHFLERSWSAMFYQAEAMACAASPFRPRPLLGK
ncbi:hypothetical protein D9Q98_005198 [Chlorella vulgaris]|uniref:Uncharacterized protein n=1 Tax=Chlorella vulgaris TaxID=3077 RepID=A0A9D4TNM7_CHLVU|nr:hypothetical protein D9Q98_005198 [Chlorella vulgaris]